MNRYCVIQDINCFYTELEEEYNGSDDDVVALCPDKEIADLISKLLAEHYKNNC